jgi:hypothetical protein
MLETLNDSMRLAIVLGLVPALVGCGCSRDADAADTPGPGTVTDVDTPGDTDTGAMPSDAVAAPDTATETDTAAETDTATADTTPAPMPERCDAWAPVQVRGTLGADKLDELSGLAASRRLPGVLWTHNDSGEKTARIFALGTDASLRATLVLDTIDPDDWEDIAMGRCSDASTTLDCIYVADTGDNKHERSEVAVVRVVEPDALPPMRDDGRAPRKSRVDTGVTSFRVRFPSRPDLSGAERKLAEHPDIEAMVVLPDRRVVFFDKREDGTSVVFRAALQAGALVTAESLGSLNLADGALKKGPSLRATAADLDLAGTTLLLRTYFRVYVLDVGGALAAPPDAAGPLLAAASAAKSSIPHGFDTQGESIAFDPAGGFWHVSEGKAQPLHFVGCASAPPPAP